MLELFLSCVSEYCKSINNRKNEWFTSLEWGPCVPIIMLVWGPPHVIKDPWQDCNCGHASACTTVLNFWGLRYSKYCQSRSIKVDTWHRSRSYQESDLDSTWIPVLLSKPQILPLLLHASTAEDQMSPKEARLQNDIFSFAEICTHIKMESKIPKQILLW